MCDNNNSKKHTSNESKSHKVQQSWSEKSQVWTDENKIGRNWLTGQQWLLQVCSKRLLILCFAEKKENATHSQLSCEIQSGEKPSLYYLIYFSRLRSSLFSISLSPSIVNIQV